jgi:hypothetical protein
MHPFPFLHAVYLKGTWRVLETVRYPSVPLYIKLNIRIAKNHYQKFETKHPEKELRGHSTNFHIHVYVL